MGVLRKLRQWLADDPEIAAFGRDLERWQAREEDQIIKFDALVKRFDRLQNRLGMRMARESARGGQEFEDAEILRRLREGGQGSKDPFWDEGEDWPRH